VPLFFVIVPLHFSWSGDGTNRIRSRGRRMDVFGDARFWFCPNLIKIYPTKSAWICGCNLSSYGTDRINNSDQWSLQIHLFVNENAIKATGFRPRPRPRRAFSDPSNFLADVIGCNSCGVMFSLWTVFAWMLFIEKLFWITMSRTRKNIA